MRPVLLFVGVLVGGLVEAATLRADDPKEAAGIVVDKAKRTVTIDAKVAPRKLDDAKYGGKIYPLEVIACWGYPKGQKAHETLVTIDVMPSAVHKAVESLGLKPGKPVQGESKTLAEGPEVNLYLEIPNPTGGSRRVAIERTMIDPKSNKPMPKVKWRFTGSVPAKPNPDKDETIYGADATGTLIAIFPVTDQTVFQGALRFKDQDYLKLETDPGIVPKVGTPVKLVIEIPASK
jgi:hypothetical protein